MRRFIQKIAGEAEERISKVQDKVTSAKNALSKAQNWLNDKKADVDNANGAFDYAIDKLEDAKDAFEQAKGPFQNALNNLDAAQDNVDNLCMIQTCTNICIPGIQCGICTKPVLGVQVPYPCCQFTSCMISIPNPKCVAANALCRIVRAAAYLALEAAKLLVRAPMLAFDLAKVALAAAQFVADKARVVLDIAKAALDLAKLGLEGAKGVLSVANAALEAVKQVVKLGLAALNFIIQYGIQSIIDVRNCGFKVQLSTHDESVFDVHCDVNAFRTGWRTVRIRINFTDIVQSIWNAAKATIEAVLNSIGSVFSGRKRREIQHQTIYTLYKILRDKRQVDISPDTELNETLNVISSIIGFQNTSEGTSYEFRREVFAIKCQDFTTIYKFFSDAIHGLKQISNETASTLENVTAIIDELDTISTDNSLTDVTFDEIGIDPLVAEIGFNISIDELTRLINEGKDNLTNNEYLNDVQATLSEAKQLLQNQTDDANNANLVDQWILASENQTTNYFSPEECASFLDCAHYEISVLYEMFQESDLSNRLEYLERVSDLEDEFLNLTGNFTHTIIDANNIASDIEDHLMYLEENNVFCSTPPVMLSPLENVTLYPGRTLWLTCNATADPLPTYTWYKDDEVLEQHTDMILLIHDLDVNNTGWYHCMAGNIVANLTFQQIYVNVSEPLTDIEEDVDDTTSPTNGTHQEVEKEYKKAGETFPVILVSSLSAGGVVVIIVIAAVVALCIRKSGMNLDKDRLYRHGYNNSDDNSYKRKLQSESVSSKASAGRVMPRVDVGSRKDNGVGYLDYHKPQYSARSLRHQ